MGLQILQIIFFHFTEDCKIYQVRFTGFIELFYTLVRSSGVDIFLLLSGLGLYYSWKRKPQLRTFYKKRFIRLLVPYVLFATPAWAIYLLLRGKFGLVGLFENVFFITLFTKGEKLLWYFAMASICYLIFPLVFSVIDNARNVWVELARVALLCLITTAVSFALRDNFYDFYIRVSLLLTRFPAFFIGVWMGKCSYEQRRFSPAVAMIAAALCYVAIIPLGWGTVPIYGSYLRFGFSFFVCLLVVALFKALETAHATRAIDGALVNLLSLVGAYTLELYMTHVFVRRVLKFFGAYPYRISIELVLIVASVVLSIALVHAAKPVQNRLLREGVHRSS